MASENDDAGDFDKLARRYLDLWQNQLSGLASDQALTEQIARLFAAANTQVASAMQAVQGAHHASQAGRARIKARFLKPSRRCCLKSPPSKPRMAPASSKAHCTRRSPAAWAGW